MNVTAVPASAPAGRDTQYKPGAQATGDFFAPSPPSRRRLRLGVTPNASPERKRRGFFRAVTAVPASAPAGRDTHT